MILTNSDFSGKMMCRLYIVTCTCLERSRYDSNRVEVINHRYALADNEDQRWCVGLRYSIYKRADNPGGSPAVLVGKKSSVLGGGHTFLGSTPGTH